MKNPHRASEGAGKHSGAAATAILAPRSARNPDPDGKNPSTRSSYNPCPYGAECCRQWIHITGTETADCAHCYQNLSRAEMARILTGL